MAVYKQKGSNRWWYKFNWNGEPIRKSTKQTYKRVAEQMEAAHKAALAKRSTLRTLVSGLSPAFAPRRARFRFRRKTLTC